MDTTRKSTLRMTAGEMQLDARKTWDKAASRRVRTRLNVPLVMGTLVAVVVLGVLGWWRHTSQSSALADAFLADADRSQEKGEWRRAARLLHDYLLLRPDDVGVRTRLAEVYDHAVASENERARSIENHRRAIGLIEPGSESETRLRRRLAELLLAAHRYEEAEAEADILLARYSESDPDADRDAADPKPSNDAHKAALRVKAIAACRQARPTDMISAPAAWDHLQAALNVLPGDAELVELAISFVQALPHHASLSEAERESRIERILNRLVDASPESAEAHLVRYRYFARKDQTDESAYRSSDLKKALALAPEVYEVQMTAGQAALQEAEDARAEANARAVEDWAEKAREHFAKARDLNPQREEAHLALGRLALVRGDADEAIRLWQAALDQLQGPQLELQMGLAEAALQAADHARAEEALDRAARAASALFTAESSSASKLLAATLQNRMKLLRAKLLLARQEPTSAVVLLRQLAVSVADGVEGSSDAITQRELSEVQYLLGLAYSRMQSWDLAAQAFHRSVEAGLHTQYALMACALAWQKAGHLERAAEYYRRLLDSSDAPPAAALKLAELRLDDQLQQPAVQRDWAEFDRILQPLEEQLPDHWEVKVLRVRRMLAAGTPEAAEKATRLLSEAEELAPDDVQLWRKLVVLYEAMGHSDRADAALARYKQLESSPQRQFALETELLARRGGHDEAARLLKRQLASADGSAATAALDRLWRVELQRGNWDEARRHLLTLHKQAPTDLNRLEDLANLDLELGNYDDVAQWEERLHSLEGEDGTLWRYFRALRQVAQANGTSDPQFLEAKRHAQMIRERRPAWGAALGLVGRIHAAEGATDRAIQAFEEALEHGDRSLSTYEQLVRQLYAAGRLSEAESYLAHLEVAVPTSGRLSHLAISLAAQQQQWSEALVRAERAVRHRSTDPLAHIWLGHVLAAQNRLPEAEGAYRQAVTVDERNPVTWQALASFYQRQDRPQDAAEALQGLKEKADLPSIQKDLAIARHFLRHGEMQRARDLLAETEQREPRSADVKRQLASLLVTEDPDLAEEKLREALQLAPESDKTRRMLATLLAARGGSERWQESIALIDEPADKSPEATDLRLQAALLVRRGGPANRAKARELLERLVRSPAPEARDLLLLAELYEGDGLVEAARSQYQAMVLRARPEPSHLLKAVEFYLRSGDAAAAKGMLENLARRNAGLSWEQRQRWAALQAKYQVVTEGEAAARSFLARWIKEDEEGTPAAAERQKVAIQILLGLDQHAAAEEWARRLSDTDGSAGPLLAQSLALQNRHREALEMCIDRGGDEVSAATVSTIAALLSCGDASPDAFEFVRPLLERAETRLSNDPQTLFALGLIAVLEERNEQAIRHFEAVHRLQPTDVRTLNNLATLYGEQPDGLDKALECIHAAIDTAGPQPVLLDTQGMLQLQQGEVEQAVASLEQAVAVPVPDPRYLFHLAAAYERAGKSEQASDAYRRATEAGLENELLTRGDKELLAVLDRQIAR